MDADDIAPPAGTRFTVDLDDDTHHEEAPSFPAALSNGLIGDISERAVSSSPALAPTFDASKSSGGFPAHTKRKRPSAFKQQRNAAAAQNASVQTSISSPPAPSSSTGRVNEMESIRAENARAVANMSSQERENERQELMDSLSPELLQMFLKRASLDDDFETSRPARVPEGKKEPPAEAPPPATKSDPPTVPQPETPAHLQDIPESAFPPSIKVHFPQPPAPSETEPEPDPNSPEFLAHLHKKYFPNLPVDPQKLAWMVPPSESEPDPHYAPTLNSILPSSVRFDFKGQLLPPRRAREVPGHLGLHHHADSPLSAGYTIPELSHLSRSSFPAQRCMAFQTLGRILYRLGIGAYSKEGGDSKNTEPSEPVHPTEKSGEERRMATDLERGLWRCIHEGRVLETLQEAGSGGKNGEGSSHLGVKNYALEALWLWQKGGGERWKAD
ncbi:hypothetical protein H072_575 [Dactylellina haptotyla CBS 200.50]|uniref:Transcription factor Rba50 n=1 Tax=Dactylellina haptotyla (strain CBS 200.50) TaxID=1284197 RepID=S8CCP2_DACHA|nr:hypothetical protein H072_575 [Dactylellina haptotyla CBS 200.50]